VSSAEFWFAKPVGAASDEAGTRYAASYTYDANGNRLTKTLNGATDNYTYDTGDKLLSISGSVSKSYTYDWAGRTKTIVGSSGTTTLNYDSAGRVSSIGLPTGTSTFAYNGMSARVKRVDPTWGTRTLVRDGLSPGSDVLFDGAATYTPGVSDRGSLGDDRYYNGDGLGSVTDVTNASGALSAQRTFTPTACPPSRSLKKAGW
jgi:YD repeat-containing protein